MSSRALTLWFIDSDSPAADLAAGLSTSVDAARELASSIYGDSVLVPAVDTDLADAMESPDIPVFAGAYGRLSVVSCSLFASPRPSTLTRTVASIRTSAAATLLYTDPAASLGAFARWENGELVRSFSATPIDINEDIGLPDPLERTFWAGEHPLRYAPGVAPAPLALPFHPQQLAEQSNREWLGFRFTRPLGDSDSDPSRIPVTGFTIHPADYQPTAADAERYRTASTRSGSNRSGQDSSGQDRSDTSSAPGAADPGADTDTGRHRGKLARYFGFGGHGSH